jgi:hypothetical protein
MMIFVFRRKHVEVRLLCLPSISCKSRWSSVQTQPIGIYSTAAMGLTQPRSQWVARPGREAGHSTPCIAEEENDWSYTFIVPYTFMLCTADLKTLKGRWTV